MLSIAKVFMEDGKAIFHLKGRLDTSSAPFLQEEIEGHKDEMSSLTLDMGSLKYISSAGIRVVLLARKLMMDKGGELHITNVPDSIAEVFEITGLSALLQ